MVFVAERKRKLLNLLKNLFFVFSVFYFSFHLISGNKGVITMFQLMQKVDTARVEVDKTQAEKVKLERKVSMMYSDSLDADLLDEQARRVLGYAGDGEIVIYLDDIK